MLNQEVVAVAAHSKQGLIARLHVHRQLKGPIGVDGDEAKACR